MTNTDLMSLGMAPITRFWPSTCRMFLTVARRIGCPVHRLPPRTGGDGRRNDVANEPFSDRRKKGPIRKVEKTVTPMECDKMRVPWMSPRDIAHDAVVQFLGHG